jgi:CRISPR-associated protein (TIGR02710 family)
VIAGLREEGFGPADIMADFTRGTKVMSAALVLVAARHGLPMLRYITGRRDQRGLVIPGEETVHEVRTSVIGESRLLDNARAFFIAGDFGAVLSLLPDPSDTRGQSPYVTMADAALGIRRMAAFYAAWDRLDYRAAAAVDLDGAPVALPEWQRLRPANAKRAWVSRLAQPAPEAPREKAALLRFLAADLLANGERRIRHCQYEDAIIRAYRILELVGQIRLFDRGLDSSDLDPKLPAGRGISKFRDAAQSGQRVKASRDDVVRLLEHLNDPLWRRLANLANAGAITAESRNHSVLIHGFTALGLPDEQPLHILFSQLADLLQADHPGAAERLAIARSVNLGAIDG